MREFIYIKENSLDPEFCDKVIEYFNNHEEEQYDGVLSSTLGNEETTEKNKKDTIDLNNTISNVSPNSEWFPIQRVLINEVKTNINEYFKKLDPENNIFFFDKNFKNRIYLETLLMHKYKKNEGKFSYHNDFLYLPKKRKYRIFNFMWYLNDVTEGGETEFFGSYKIKPEKGKMVIFPSEWFFPHTGKIPISDDKYIVTGWIYNNIV